MMPLIVSVAPEATSMVPLLVPKVIPRLALSVKLAVLASVPPLIIKFPALLIPDLPPDRCQPRCSRSRC